MTEIIPPSGVVVFRWFGRNKDIGEYVDNESARANERLNIYDEFPMSRVQEPYFTYELINPRKSKKQCATTP